MEKMLGFPSDPKKWCIPNAIVKDGDESEGRIRKSPSQTFP